MSSLPFPDHPCECCTPQVPIPSTQDLKKEREKEGLVAPGNGCLEPEDMEQSQEQMFFFQIVCATIDNNKIILNIDNSRMTADDFRVK